MASVFAKSIAAALTIACSGCTTTTRDHVGFLDRAASEAKPVVLPIRAMTSFTGALGCMDTMLLSAGIRDVPIAVKAFVDGSGKAGVAADQLVTSALSEMSVSSNAFRTVEYEVDQIKQDTVQSIGQMLVNTDMMVITPPRLYIYGSIPYIDQGVGKDEKSVGASAPRWSIGGGKEIEAATIAVSMKMGEFKSKQFLPGIHSDNQITVGKSQLSSDGDSAIRKYGITFNFGRSYVNGNGAAVRTLVELGMIELVGKWANLPYWKCLAVDQSNPEFQRELQDWYTRLPKPQLNRLFQKGLHQAGYYNGPTDGRENQELREAVTRFQLDKGLPALGYINFEAYEKLIGDYVRVDSAGHFVRADWLRIMHEESKPDYRANQRNDSKSALIAAEPNTKAAPIEISLVTNPRNRNVMVGDALNMTISLSRGGYLRCYMQDTAGVVQQVFPNRYQNTGFIAARRQTKMPHVNNEGNGYSLPFDAVGKERVLCFATEADVANITQMQSTTVGRAIALQPIAGITSLDQVEYAYTQALGTGKFSVARLEFNVRPAAVAVNASVKK
jgi:peptidoglycan hydrolase-like protein with peptidoglycan-binding domain